MRSNIRQSSIQPQLEGIDVSEEGWWRCRGIFSRNYLEQHLRHLEFIPTQDECRPLHNKLRSLWLDNLEGLRNNIEAYTRTKFLDPTLKDLDWFFIPEQSLPVGLTRKRPDYCLFLDEATEQYAAKQQNVLNVFRATASALEAKRAEYPLDQKEDKKSETPGLYPSQQVQDYLHCAKDGHSRFFDWAILTNGSEWRLYCENAPTDAYFAFDLAQGDQFCPLNDFCLFVTLFRKQAFDRLNGRCVLDDFRDQSLVHQEELETKLRRRVFNVLEELAEGFYFNADNGLTVDDLGEVYDNSLIFLYRLLFILYAESRGLLPTRPSGPQSNKRYRQEFSLQRFMDSLRDAKSYPDDAFYDLYEAMLKLFSLINGTHKAQNEALQVTRYNGGLFNPKKHPLLETWRIGEKTLANVLRQLMFAQPPARGRGGQQVILMQETVDYGTLEVRQLGDIYEGLLGGKLALRPGRCLELVDDDGENHSKGIFYTPDWIVGYLIRETLQPLVDEAQAAGDVQAALSAQSAERKQNNAFALGVLGLNIVDPAMGSGHFLVRATEWLAEQIVYHPTTREMTEQITRQRRREDIVAAGRIPVPAGVSQEEAETAYWRRRVVEACIYGVDTNPLAVELAKLSLWLTCIAVDEPLSFLDHHLRCGNSLLSVDPEATNRLPYRLSEEEDTVVADIGAAFSDTLRDVIAANMRIETEASTEMEVVKAKEQQWKTVQDQLEPFRDTLDLWIAALDRLEVGEQALNAFDYRVMTLHAAGGAGLAPSEIARAEQLWKTLQPQLAAKKEALHPFHWRVEFPAVFYGQDGALKPIAKRGFDAVLGNPPYISTHTSSAASWRRALELRAGYLDDLYVHFTDMGFGLLRQGGGFGFIVSDTFFTLASKERMRLWLQEYRLTHLGQCDPFDATVDAAIFVARKEAAQPDDVLLFVQARPATRNAEPEKELVRLPPHEKLEFGAQSAAFGAKHGEQGCLRTHEVPVSLYRQAFKRAFFEPRPGILHLYQRFNEPVKTLVETWWDFIKTSQDVTDNLDALRRYQADLQPGDITLVGLIAEGGQGMRTANNARFLGYLAGTPQAKELLVKRTAWTRQWLANPAVAPTFRRLLRENGGDPDQPLADSAAWEACIEPMKAVPKMREELGFGRGELYRVVPAALLATPPDFEYAWQRRRDELWQRWRTHSELNRFWTQMAVDAQQQERQELRASDSIGDADFCLLCQELQAWVIREKKRRAKARPKEPVLPRDLLGLRSSENYADPADALRIAAIYNGLSGHGQWVAFRKGDPDGSRWTDNIPLFIEWSAANVQWLFDNNGKSEANMPVIRNPHIYFTPGVTYTLLGNHVSLKAKYQEPCVFDAGASRLTPVIDGIKPECLLAIFNSNIFSFYLKKFLKNTAAFEITDLRMTPIVIPTPEQSKALCELAERASEAKRLTFSTSAPTNALVDFTRALTHRLTTEAPAYLKPSAQLRLLSTAADCLAAIELAVNWEAEKLYGVEGNGPFNEF